ncbi:zinc finger protein 672-like [Cloeon dipterum]|uniref:zinc finger protein 672-like n=1 Tax=Cloeon dipterum TaxID=197152 RepID=UPI00321FA8C7
MSGNDRLSMRIKSEENSSSFQDDHGYATMHFNIKTEPMDSEYESDSNTQDPLDTTGFVPQTEKNHHSEDTNNSKNFPSNETNNIANVRRELHCCSFNIYEPLLKLSYITGNDTETASKKSANTQQQPFDCPVCSQSMADAQALHRHVIGAHPAAYGINFNAICPGCDCQFDCLPLLDKHLSNQPSCTPERLDKGGILSCRYCHTFSCRDAILWHESTQHSKEFLKTSRFKCCMCPRHFPQFQQCKEHILKRECLNICVACKKVFPMLYLLAEHINKKHLLVSSIFLTTVNSMMCSNCGTQFQKPGEQVGHICPKYCRLCDATFPAYSLYANHIWQIHHNWVGFCETCKSVFDNKEVYARHVSHRVCKQCKNCRFPFNDLKDKSKHKCSTEVLPPITYTVHALAPRVAKDSALTESGEIYCNLCGLHFLSDQLYHEHLGEPDRCLGCRLCTYVASNKKELVQHVLREHEHTDLGLSVTEHKPLTAPTETQVPDEVTDYGAVTDFEGYCAVCKQIVDSKDDFEENHMATFKCIECSVVLRCKLNYMKHIARAHSSTCTICKKYTDFINLHNLKRHAQAAAIPLDQPVALFSCSKCNVHAFELQVLLKKAEDPESCQHIRSLWQFDL